MQYPTFLKDGDKVGVTACSCGILSKVEKYEKTVEQFNSNGFTIVETSNVRTDGLVSSSAYQRWLELKNLLEMDDVKGIAIASGGDFLFEMLPFIEKEVILKNCKWLMGSSDPTSLLFFVTTCLDIATIYSPCNMSGMDSTLLHPSYLNYFSILKGNLIRQEKYEYQEDLDNDTSFTLPNPWYVSQEKIEESGRLIGGCIECLKDCIGTPYDGALSFIERYKEEGIIWYFDIFSMSPETLCNTLLQFKYAGWFSKAKAIVFGKVRFPSTYSSLSYEEAILRAIPDIPFIYKFDIGHVKPSFTMINGARVYLKYDSHNQYIEYV